VAVRLPLLAGHGDETKRLEPPEPPVAGHDGDVVPPTQLERGGLALLGGEENACRVRIENHAGQDEGIARQKRRSPAVAAPPGALGLFRRGETRVLGGALRGIAHGIRFETKV